MHSCAKIVINSERAFNFSLFLVHACIQAYKKILKECPYGLKIGDSTNFNMGDPKKWLKISYSSPYFFIKYDS